MKNKFKQLLEDVLTEKPDFEKEAWIKRTSPQHAIWNQRNTKHIGWISRIGDDKYKYEIYEYFGRKPTKEGDKSTLSLAKKEVLKIIK